MAKSYTMSLVDRVLVFFARNPEETLTTVDVSVKFAVPQEEVRASLRFAAIDGRLKKDTRGPPHPVTYSAGPALLESIGAIDVVQAMQACASTGG